jgi:hypothetical protein
VNRSGDGFWFVQLDDESARRRDQGSFHVFAEGVHSDVRGVIHNLSPGDSLVLPTEKWPRHLFIVVGISGALSARVRGEDFLLRAASQLVVLPGVACQLRAESPAAIELLSLLSMHPSALAKA